MIDQKILSYVEGRLQQGATKEQIQADLFAQGLNAQDINQVLNFSASPVQAVSDSDIKPPQSAFLRPALKTNKIFPLVVSLIGGIILIGGGVFAYSYFFPSPEKVIGKMADKRSEIKSLEFSGKMNSAIKMGDLQNSGRGGAMPFSLFSADQKIDTSVDFFGAMDVNDLKNPKFSVTLGLETDLVPMLKLDIGTDLKLVDKKAYIKLNNLPNLGFIDLSAISSQWIKIDPAELENKYSQLGTSLLKEKLDEAKKKQKLTADQIKKINTVLKQAKVYKITDKLSSEKIEGVSTYHYRYLIDKEELKKFYFETIEIINPELLSEASKTMIDEGLATIESIAGELWIGKKDYFPYKATINYAIKETEKSKTSGQVSGFILLKRFNQPVQIQAPSESKSLQDLISGLFGGLQGITPAIKNTSANQPGLSASLDTDSDGLADDLEVYYGTDKNNPDTDGDGFKDGDEVKNGYNPNGEGKL